MIPQFAMRLICGLATAWCVAPRRQITSGYFRIQMLLTLGLSVLFALTVSQLNSASSSRNGGVAWQLALAVVLGGLSFVGSVFWTLERRRAGAVCGVLIWGLAAVVVCWSGAARGNLAAASALGLGEALTSAWLLGSVTATMLLGHWYLTATGMSLQPLRQYALVLEGAVLLRILVVSWGAAGAASDSGGNWTLEVLRWGGLFGPLVMVGLVLRILKYRNTQSATGVLYAATILVFMGEMAAALLARSQANPSSVW